jgi:hypothetical protein
MFPVRYGQTYRVELSFKQKTGRRIMFKIVIAILHRRLNRRLPGLSHIATAFVILDKARPRIENISGSNLVAVMHTTVQVSNTAVVD